jgi:hypothetical protein
MRTMNVCEYSEYVNHKDRGVKYPEYREEVPSRRSIPSKKVAGSDVVTPRSSLLRESVRVDGGVSSIDMYNNDVGKESAQNS